MGILQRQSVYSFTSSYLGMVLGVINRIVLFPYFFKGEEEYWGLLEVYVAFAMIIGSVGSAGMPRVLIRFLPGLEKNRETLMSFTLLVSLVGGLLVFTGVFFGEDWISSLRPEEDIPLFKSYYHLLLLLVFVMLFFEYFSAVLIANYKTHLPIFLNNVTFRIGVTLVILFSYLFSWSLEVFMYLYVGIYLVNLLLAVGYLRLRNMLQFDWKTDFSNKEYWMFGLFSVFVGSSGWVLNYMDTLIVNAYLPLALIPYLAISKNIASLVHMPARAVIQASTPLVAKAWNNNDRETIIDIYKKTAITELVVGGIIFLGIWINIDFIIKLFPNDGEYYRIKYIVLALGIGRLLDLMTGANSVIISNSKHYRFSLYVNLTLVLIAVILNIILIPKLQLLGAGIALGAAIGINNIIMIIYLWVKERMHPFTRHHAVFLVFFALILLLLSPNYGLEMWLVTLLRNVIFTVAVAWFIFVYKPVKEINDFFQKIVKRFFKRSR